MTPLQALTETFIWIRWLARQAQPPEYLASPLDEFTDGMWKISVADYKKFGQEIEKIAQQIRNGG